MISGFLITRWFYGPCLQLRRLCLNEPAIVGTSIWKEISRHFL
jgi:hypothetical protein